MKPSQTAQALQHIASKIENSRNPNKSLVAKDLQQLITRIAWEDPDDSLSEAYDLLKELVIKYLVPDGQEVITKGGHPNYLPLTKPERTDSAPTKEEIAKFKQGFPNILRELEKFGYKEVGTHNSYKILVNSETGVEIRIRDSVIYGGEKYGNVSKADKAR
jgi:hypothetical protein